MPGARWFNVPSIAYEAQCLGRRSMKAVLQAAKIAVAALQQAQRAG